jgi:hypothetical protein
VYRSSLRVMYKYVELEINEIQSAQSPSHLKENVDPHQGRTERTAKKVDGRQGRVAMSDDIEQFLHAV